MSIQIRKIIRPAEAEGALPPHTHGVADITDFPEAMPPSEHTHEKADITNFGHAATHESGDDKLTNLATGLQVGGKTVWHEGNLDPSGLGVDPAADTYIVRAVAASDTIRHAALTERSGSGIHPKLVKSFELTSAGTMRISFEIKASSTGRLAKADIVINGTVVQTPLTTSASYVAQQLDLEVKDPVNLIQVKVYTKSSADTCYIRNVRIRYDFVEERGVILD